MYICLCLQTEWQRRALAYGPKYEDPPRPMTHWDFLLKEAFWMAKDFGQVRLQSKQPASQPAASLLLASTC